MTQKQNSLGQLWLKLTRDPIGLFRRVIQKRIIQPQQYASDEGGYDAARYWHDRFTRYGDSLRGVGDEGLPEDDNARQYAEAAQRFLALCHDLSINFAQARVLEIGPGTGFYTELLQSLQVKNYLGVDITNAQFGKLRQRFPTFRFMQSDVTTDPIEGSYDLIVMIDVIEHIVTEEKLAHCLAMIDRCLAPGGVFILAPLMSEPQKHLFYVRFWALAEVSPLLPGYRWSDPIAFRGGSLYAIHKP